MAEASGLNEQTEKSISPPPPERNPFGQLREKYEKVRPAVRKITHKYQDGRHRGKQPSSEIRKLIQSVSFNSALEEHDTMEQMQGIDELTHLLNRHGYYKKLADELHRASRTNTPVTIVFCDANGLKRVNDLYGHKYGDELLIGYAQALAQKNRVSDALARFAGDEFIFILPNTSLKEADGWSEKKLKMIEGKSCELSNKHSIPLALGFGSFTITPEMYKDLLEKDKKNDFANFLIDQTNLADIAMYFSKQSSKQTGGLSLVHFENLTPEQIEQYQQEKQDRAGSHN